MSLVEAKTAPAAQAAPSALASRNGARAPGLIEADNISIPAFRISNDSGPYPRCGGRDATIVGTEAGEVR